MISKYLEIRRYFDTAEIVRAARSNRSLHRSISLRRVFMIPVKVAVAEKQTRTVSHREFHRCHPSRVISLSRSSFGSFSRASNDRSAYASARSSLMQTGTVFSSSGNHKSDSKFASRSASVIARRIKSAFIVDCIDRRSNMDHRSLLRDSRREIAARALK